MLCIRKLRTNTNRKDDSCCFKLRLIVTESRDFHTKNTTLEERTATLSKTTVRLSSQPHLSRDFRIVYLECVFGWQMGCRCTVNRGFEL